MLGVQQITMRPLTRPTLRTYAYVCPSCQRGLRSVQRTFASYSPQLPDIYDIVCVGGGPAGLGLVTALSMPAQWPTKRVNLQLTPIIQEPQRCHLSSRSLSLTARISVELVPGRPNRRISRTAAAASHRLPSPSWKRLGHGSM